MTTQTATTQRVTYRRTQRGEWVVYGPADIIRPLRDVEVTTRDGRTRIEPIASVGKTFLVDGVKMCYGYIDQDARRALRVQRQQPSQRPHTRRSRCDTCRCHREPNAGQPGTALYDGCDYCGCQAA